MALESSGGLRSSSSPIKLRSSLVVLSAGAALVALIGYLFMKSRQSPPASKQSSSSSTTSSTTSTTSKSEKSQIVEEEEKQEEESLERISQELVRIVLNCAAKKMANDSDDFTHLMSNESKRSESKRNRNKISGGADETELDEATHELSMHSISLLETDSSSSSSAAEHTTSIIESPNVSYHQETTSTATSNQKTSTNLTKSSSTTSTASTASSATVEPSQQQRQFTNKQTQSSKQQQNKKVSSHQKTNKPKPLNVHNRNTNDKHKPLPKSNHQMSESQEETQRQQQQHHQDSQPVSLNSSTTADANHEDIIVYEFNFPRKFCGKLIGKNGVHVDHIRSKTRTQIAVRDDADNHEQQIVCVSGRLEDVDQALDIISSRFPLKQYPTISFKPISKPIVYRRINNEVESDRVLPYESTSVKKVLVAPNMFVEIKPAAIEPMNVHVSAVVNASHVFVQFPDNSTYASLQKLDECMFEVYSRQSNNESSSEEPVPIMSEPIEFGSICVAPTSYGWHRAMVTTYLSLDEARAQYADYGEECGLATVKFLDYGGYLTIPANQLRQLRSDFMLLPFQAVECYLDGIFVNQGAEEEGKKFLTEIIKGAQIKLSLCGYADDGIPLIKLFLTNDIYQNVNLNSELINYSNNL